MSVTEKTFFFGKGMASAGVFHYPRPVRGNCRCKCKELEDSVS